MSIKVSGNIKYTGMFMKLYNRSFEAEIIEHPTNYGNGTAVVIEHGLCANGMRCNI